MSGPERLPERDEPKEAKQGESSARLLAELQSSTVTQKPDKGQLKEQETAKDLPSVSLLARAGNDNARPSEAKDNSFKPSPLDVSEKEKREITRAIADLANSEFEKREAAEKALKEYGAKALPFLLEALQSNQGDAEVPRRIRQIVDERYNAIVSRPFLKDAMQTLEDSELKSIQAVGKQIKLSLLANVAWILDDTTMELRATEISYLQKIMTSEKLGLPPQDQKDRITLLEEHRKDYVNSKDDVDIKKMRSYLSNLVDHLHHLEVDSGTNESLSSIKFCKNLVGLELSNHEVIVPTTITRLKEVLTKELEEWAKHGGVVYCLKIDDKQLGIITGLNMIRDLHLEKCKLTDEGMKHLSSLKRLSHLSLSRCKISDAGLEHLKDLEYLHNLSLDHTGITDTGLKHLSSWKHLNELGLHEPAITGTGLEHLKNLQFLRVLKLGHTGITDGNLKHLSGLENLSTLDLSETAINGTGLEHLKNLQDLRSLSLRHTAVTDDSLKHLKDLQRLEILQLDHTAITDAGLKHLKDLQRLRVLDLGHTALTDNGLKHLEGLAKSLGALKLSETSITDNGLKHLDSLAKNLYFLDLSKTAVTDAAIDKLGTMKNLKYLYLSHTAITTEGVKELKKMLPECDIYWYPAK